MTFESSVSLQSEAIIDFEEAGRFRQQLEQLEDEITRTAGHINAIDYYFIKLLVDFDERHGWVGTGIKSFAHWLNWKCGLGQLEATSRMPMACTCSRVGCLQKRVSWYSRPSTGWWIR